MALFHLYLFFFLSGFHLFHRNCLPSATSLIDAGGSPPTSDQLQKLGQHQLPVATEDNLQLLTKVLGAIEEGLMFMQRAERDLILDAIIGTRIVEGQLTVLMSRLLKENSLIRRLPAETVARIQSIRLLADRISTETIPFLKQKQPNYYKNLSAILGRRFWALSYPTREVNSSAMVQPIVSGEAMDEGQSDNCLTGLLGTSGETTEKCRMLPSCWKLMTQPGFQHYSLTHQVFFAEIGTSFGCFTSDLRKLTDGLSFGYCSNILVEAEAIASANFPYDKTDLFMEQAALCGILGFKEFFRPDWLEAILLWQWHPEGCWGVNKKPSKQRSMRYRRSERILVGGCRCHRTSVALGALVGYVRFLSESVSSRNNSISVVVINKA